MERPILFSAPMVRALLEGRKTQTRRVVLHKRQQPPEWATWVNHLKQLTMKHEWVDSNIFQWSEEQTPGKPLKPLRRWPSGEIKVGRKYTTEMDYAIPCPYGVPEDRLWIRETWQAFFEDEVPADRPRGPQHTMGIPAQPERKSFVYYRADGELTHSEMGCARWIPSIHMPRKYSRLTLEITSVRVERVQDISEEDAKAEGVTEYGHQWIPMDVLKSDPKSADYRTYTARDAFHGLWDSINAARGYGWEVNPWVWVLEFKRVEVSRG